MRFALPLLTTLALLGLLPQCNRRTTCPPILAERLVREIQEASPDHRLNIFATPGLLLINGAKIAKITGGKLSAQGDEEIYTPLLEAIYNEFKQRGEDPYREIFIHAHEKLPRSLLRRIQTTALSTHLAPVILLPIDFAVTRCTYQKRRTVATKRLTIPNNILIRQERDQILVDGEVVVSLSEGRLPPQSLGKGGIVIAPLLKSLKSRLKALQQRTPHPITPVLHITYDANLKITSYILITAGKVGIFKLKTVRVLP